MLNLVTEGAGPAPPLLIAHGLFGSARNWGVIQKRLSDTRVVTAVDMRNHGDSFHDPVHDYNALADDLAGISRTMSAPPHVLGHSMGGKSSMMLALTHPELVRSLIVADIAPVAYGHSQLEHVRAMREADLVDVTRRSQAKERLAVDDPALVSFFLQSLEVRPDGARWKYNLDALADQMPEIMGFPDVGGSYAGPTLFLTGSRSDYVKMEHRGRIRDLFPKAKFAKIPGAGHWLHAEKPREFEAAVRAWMESVDS